MEKEEMKKKKEMLAERIFTLIEEISELKEKQSKVNKKIRLFEVDLGKIVEKEKLCRPTKTLSARRSRSAS
jgi:uncharacterized coiled-coil DUF342 family protein